MAKSQQSESAEVRRASQTCARQPAPPPPAPRRRPPLAASCHCFHPFHFSLLSFFLLCLSHYFVAYRRAAGAVCGRAGSAEPPLASQGNMVAAALLTHAGVLGRVRASCQPRARRPQTRTAVHVPSPHLSQSSRSLKHGPCSPFFLQMRAFHATTLGRATGRCAPARRAKPSARHPQAYTGGTCGPGGSGSTVGASRPALSAGCCAHDLDVQ